MPGRHPGEHRRGRGLPPRAAAGGGSLEAHAWLSSCPCRCTSCCGARITSTGSGAPSSICRSASSGARRTRPARRSICQCPTRAHAPPTRRAGGRSPHPARAEHCSRLARRRAHIRAQDDSDQRPPEARPPLHRHGHGRLQHRVVAGADARGALREYVKAGMLVEIPGG